MRFTIARFVGLLAVLLTACTPPAPTTPSGGASAPTQPAEQRDERQVLNIAVGAVTANMTPAASGGHWIRWHLYDTVAKFGKDWALEPQVAEKWDISADGRSWKFTIRKDLKFSNGDPLTADDVAFTFQQIFEKSWPVAANFASMDRASVKATDPATFEFTTRAADLTVLASMPLVFVVPKKYYEQIGFEAFVTKPIGSGPYELVEFKADTSVHFRKRADVHPIRKVANNELLFRQVTDQGQQVNGLRTGDLDLSTIAVFTNDQLATMKREEIKVQFFKVSTLAFSFPEGTLEARESPLKDKRVRQALNYAIDRAAIASLFQEAEATAQMAIPGSPYLDPDVRPTPFDAARAKQLLTEAGYPNGFKLSTPIEFNPFTLAPNIALAVQANLKAIGIEAELAQLDFVTNSNKLFGRNNLQKSEMYGSVVGDTNGFVTGIRASFGCGKPVGGAPGSVFWCNAEWDRLMDQAYAERDVTKRVALFRQANKLMRDEVPTMPLIVQPSHSAWSSKIRGVTMDYFFYFTLDSAYKVK